MVGTQSFDTGFSILDFTVDIGGTQVVNEHFTTLASAMTYFTDDAVDLGAISQISNLTVNFTFDLFTSTVSDGFGEQFLLGTTNTVICFLAGTRIMTPNGEIAVEKLALGDSAVTHSGAVRRIVWIGTGQVLATRGRRNAATPVIVRKGALGDNVPYADLRVTKAHSLYIDNVLIPVEFLVNHRSIVWDDHAREVTIYHIELETHNILLANGTPAESYRDDGNRWLFRNANTGWGLPPQAPYAPVLTGGPVVDAAWRRLLDRAGPRAGMPSTGDPDLHLVVDGRRTPDQCHFAQGLGACLPASGRAGCRAHHFPDRRPAGDGCGSRSAVPGGGSAADHGDPGGTGPADRSQGRNAD
jgi:hypothetical protein